MARMNRTYRYPATLRVPALFASLLAGGILIGSLLAEIEAADALDFVLHMLALIVSGAIVWLGVELGMRRITLTGDGLTTHALSERKIAWSDVREVREGLFGTLIVVFRRGGPIVVWPFLEDFGLLLEALSTLLVRPDRRRGGG
jgi:hypothetical protein